MSKERQIDTPTCTNLHQSCTNLTPTYTNSAVGELKQIEEMAKEIEVMHSCKGYADDRGCYYARTCTSCKNANRENSMKIAKRLYNAGYRKQSENVIELPCNIGDVCYPLPRYKTPIVERKVSRITLSKRNIIIGYYENDGQYRPPLRTRILGEDVFLTKEEAEAKMKGGAE